ncbi:hypothetical protein K7X08_035926 [Anisodus acutangulus]|uniref:Nuclear factor related to kappa-B-binding protein second winged helix domain-containing protein n=1 Tax=Anisodus acutangulus TaxID=402998 RepID=A0A9Q1QVS0_9SOLA|nr:hypothetical protein K7X08_035926 [Anisodus acutangulus]
MPSIEDPPHVMEKIARSCKNFAELKIMGACDMSLLLHWVFPYTAVDGQRSAVAPLKRDAVARLPGGVGTRADICVLVRDSQFIVEDISDLQVSQVVSGALDRLHYENDPCERFDKEWRLWAYLHGDRLEEDFEYDSTFSNKSRKRAKENELQSAGGRDFPYTVVDGQRSSVAPLKRVTAARLPGGIQTRADICVLVRDSQFIVEDISDSQVSQVIFIQQRNLSGTSVQSVGI